MPPGGVTTTGGPDGERVLVPPGGLDVGATLDVLGGHAVPGGERHDAAAATHTRLLEVGGAAVAVTVTLAPDAVRVRAPHADPDEVAAAVRFWLDLDLDVRPVEAGLARDPLLAPLVAARPGLRVVRQPDPFEAAVMAVVGQQVSLASARTFTGRLVTAYGEPGPEGLRRFPRAEVVAAVPAERLRELVGLTGARARSLQAVAAAFADGLRLDPGGDREAARRDLLALPGVGPWTADYLAVRVLADPDAFTPGDLVLRRAMGDPTPAEAERRSQAWRPWRAYALGHLWAHATELPARRPRRPSAHGERLPTDTP